MHGVRRGGLIAQRIHASNPEAVSAETSFLEKLCNVSAWPLLEQNMSTVFSSPGQPSRLSTGSVSKLRDCRNVSRTRMS